MASKRGARVGARPPRTTTRIARAEPPDMAGSESLLTRAVPRRRPRLVWHGFDAPRPATVAPPARVIERVRPGGDAVADSGETDNRLIWTGDNLLALQTLLAEREPQTGEYRYRRKVDLIYIDPPFMAQSDFHAESALDVDLDAAAGVRVKLLAYKDRWREGLDAFLSMLQARLELLRELLAPTGSVYVHLDWHAAHYVKVLMDEVFGYENFRNEIVWYYYNKYQGNIRRFASNHDTILCYGGGGRVWFEAQKEPRERPERQLVRVWDGVRGRLVNAKDEDGSVVYQMSTERGVDDVWRLPMLQPADRSENLGYPTQKRRAVVERIVAASCPPGGLVLDCFHGSGTVAEAAERLGRRWIGIDCGKHAIDLARRRLLALHGEPRPPARPRVEFVECEQCKHVERKAPRQRSPGPFAVRPSTCEQVGVYARPATATRGEWRAALIAACGGTPVEGSAQLHGELGEAWIHVGPLASAITAKSVWAVARAAAATERRRVMILAAGGDAIAEELRAAIAGELGVTIGVRWVPAVALAAIAGDEEITAMPGFHAPLAIRLQGDVHGRVGRVQLVGCEIDVASLLAGAAGPRAELERWLAREGSWRRFVTSWAIDWDHGRERDALFTSTWHSVRGRKSDGLVFTAEREFTRAGRFLAAARVIDVFGNEGSAAVELEVK